MVISKVINPREMLDAGYWILDTRCWILETRNQKPERTD